MSTILEVKTEEKKKKKTEQKLEQITS